MSIKYVGRGQKPVLNFVADVCIINCYTGFLVHVIRWLPTVLSGYC